MIVVDASLALKWLLVEVDSDEALLFLASHRGGLIGPDLLAVEVTARLVREANQVKALRPAMEEGLSTWATFVAEAWIGFHVTDAARLKAAAYLAIDLGHPLADCIYLALAMELQATLATCDVKFRDRAIGTYPNIRLLSEFDLPTNL